jgi:hypothetical protein
MKPLEKQERGSGVRRDQSGWGEERSSDNRIEVLAHHSRERYQRGLIFRVRMYPGAPVPMGPVLCRLWEIRKAHLYLATTSTPSTLNTY